MRPSLAFTTIRLSSNRGSQSSSSLMSLSIRWSGLRIIEPFERSQLPPQLYDPNSNYSDVRRLLTSRGFRVLCPQSAWLGGDRERDPQPELLFGSTQWRVHGG